MTNIDQEYIYILLESKYEEYNRLEFISRDPICIPHQFKLKQDREIMGFWAAMLSWGWRPTIINKANEIINLMGGEPYRFIMEHRDEDLKPFLTFKHRTFNSTDTLYFIDFFRRYYSKHESLEDAFINADLPYSTYKSLETFNAVFFDVDHPIRTRKHVSRPSSGSTCKRLNMFLRWMVRHDEKGVDFGIWKRINPSHLSIPLDLHVERVARKLGLITRKQCDWKTVIELTQKLTEFDILDPVKYDFALFSLGIEEHF